MAPICYGQFVGIFFYCSVVKMLLILLLFIFNLLC